MSKRAKIFLVDDHPIIREHLTVRIDQQSDLTVCGAAHDSPGARAGIAHTRPAVAIIELRLQNGSSLGMIKDLRAEHPRVAVLVYTMYDEPDLAERAFAAGAGGYATKTQPTDEVLTALRQLVRGERYVAPALAVALAVRLLPGNGRGTGKISNREHEVSGLLARGRSTKQICAELHLSRGTITTYRDRLKLKWGVRTDRELVSACGRHHRCHGCPRLD